MTSESSKWTDGPWQIFPCPGKSERVTIGPVEPHSNLVKCVALAYDDEPANQRLIAATPEMAALLETVGRMKCDGEDGFVMENDDAVETVNRLIGEARALLARIRGGE